MAYTFHIGSSRDAAARRRACCALEEPVHDAIFRRIRQYAPRPDGAARELKCPLLNRCHDYYADARFGGEELSLLRAEVQHLKAEFSGSAGVLEFLACLERACRDAGNGGLRLFGFGD